MNKGNTSTSIENDLFCDFCDNGNQKSLTKLYDRIKPWACSIIRRDLIDKSATEDVFHDVFINVIGMRDRFDPQRGDIRALIYTIANNQTKRWWRDNKKHLLNHLSIQSKGTLSAVDEKQYEISSELMVDREILNYAIEKLPKKHQKVFQLFYFGDNSIKEIASILNIPEGTIKTWLDRDREQLEKILRKYQ